MNIGKMASGDAFRKSLVVSGALVVVFMGVVPAWADQSDRVLAQSLFEQGRKLMEAGNYRDACPKLARSQQLDPGGGTLLNLGICYEKAGKTASAWAAFEEAASLLRKSDDAARVEFAQEHARALRAKLSRLRVNVSPALRKIQGLELVLDGKKIPKEAWGTAMPIDPGGHRLEAMAPGKRTWSQQVDIQARPNEQTFFVPPLEDLPDENPASDTVEKTDGTGQQPEATSSSASGQSSGTEPEPKPVVPSQEKENESRFSSGEISPDSSQKTWAYVVGGAGVVALGVGSFFGVQAFSSWSDRNNHCVDGVCDAQAVASAEDANTQGTIANVMIPLGLVGVGVGTYLFLTSSDSKEAEANRNGVGWRVQPTVGNNAAGMQLGGTW